MQHQQPAVENQNRVYEVDRDPEPFRYVLSWMRSHRLAPAIAQDSRMLDALVVEATFYGLDDLLAAVQTALAPLQRASEPLRAFSITCGTVLVRNSGVEVQQGLRLAPHEYCLVSFASCATNVFALPRKHHTVWCSFEERKAGSDDEWKPMVPGPTGPAPNQAAFENVHAWYAEHRIHEKKASDKISSRVQLASFVYKHLSDRDTDDEAEFGVSVKQVVTDGACSPQFSQRLHAILGPRGVHNPEVTTLKVDAEKNKMETRLVFGPDCELMPDNGATWSLFGVVGPAEKVLEYAARCI